MKTIKFLTNCIIAAAFLVSNCLAQGQGNGQNPQQPTSYKSFVENQGQLLDTDGNLRPDILYYTSAAGTKVYYMNDMLCHVWGNKDTIGPDTLYRMDLEFVGHNPSVQVTADENTQGYMNYYLAHIPNGVTNVPTWDKLTYTDLWPNIDMVTRNKGRGLEYEFTLHPGADPNDIRLRFPGATKVEIDNQGRLKAETPKGNMRYEHPTGRRKDGKKDIPVKVDFVKDQNGQITITIANFKAGIKFQLKLQTFHGVPVPVPPTGFSNKWATYYGDASGEQSNNVYIDNSRNIYMTGFTASSNFPTTTGVIQTTLAGQNDAFVVKFNQFFGREWATLYGGSGSDISNGITADASGNVYFTGSTTSSNFPVCSSCSGFFQGTLNGVGDGFIVKLNDEGDTKLWATYYGGSGSADGAHDIILDNSVVYITGLTNSSTGFPLQSFGGAYNQASNGGGLDAYVSKFTTTGTLIWATYFGGTGTDRVKACTVDNTGNLFITGYTSSNGLSTCVPVAGEFPLCDPGGAYVAGNSGSIDAFIVEFTNTGTLQWSTMYGGSGMENNTLQAGDIVTDLSGNIYVTGGTEGMGFPLQTLTGAYNQGTYGGGSRDAFLLKFTSSGVREWATFYGGSLLEIGAGITASPQGDIFITGFTQSSDFPVLNFAGFYFQPNNAGGSDTYLLWFNQNGEREWATNYGGSGSEIATGIALSDPFFLIITGFTASTDFPVQDAPGTLDYFDGTYNGGSDDAFIANFQSFCNPCFKIGETATSADNEMNESVSGKNFSIYPNPNHGNLMLRVEQQQEQDIAINLFNTMGVNVYSERLNVSSGVETKQLDLSRLTKGMYLMNVKIGDKVTNHKLLLQ